MKLLLRLVNSPSRNSAIRSLIVDGRLLSRELGRRPSLPNLLSVGSMEAVSDLFSNSLHFFWRDVFDALGVHEFCVTISWKSRDHMDVRVWHAHSSNVSNDPFRVHGLLEGLRDRTNRLEVSSSFRNVPDPSMMLLRRDQRVSRV